MTTFFDGRSGIGVHQRRKVFELRNQYTLTDEDGADAGRVEQARQSALAWLARLGTSLDAALPTTLEVTDAAGRAVLVLHKPWFTWKVSVADPDGRAIGVISRRIRVGKPVYALVDPNGADVGEVRAEDWRSRRFEVLDPAGTTIGRVTKQWRGLFAEVVTDADSYAVTFEPQATSDQRALTFAGALTVDLIQKQKDTGWPACATYGRRAATFKTSQTPSPERDIERNEVARRGTPAPSPACGHPATGALRRCQPSSSSER